MACPPVALALGALVVLGLALYGLVITLHVLYYLPGRVRSGLRELFLGLEKCPSCRALLRAPAARQCFRCGLDWHDSDPVVRHKS